MSIKFDSEKFKVLKIQKVKKNEKKTSTYNIYIYIVIVKVKVGGLGPIK